MINKPFVLTILKVIVTFSMLASCAPMFQTPTPTDVFPTITPEPYPVWLTNWLEKPTCAPPCWENIIPGKTTRPEARTALSKVPAISSIEDYDNFPYGKGLYWLYGNIYFDDKNTVQMIMFHTSSLKMPLNDLLVHFGTPQYVVYYGLETNTVIVDLTYSRNGLVISLYKQDFMYDASDNIIVNIAPNDPVSDIALYDLGFEYYYSFARGNPLPRYDWKGYATYP